MSSAGGTGDGERDTVEDSVISHVLEAIRGGDTPDVIPAQSTAAGFAEFLAVEAELDRRWPETAIDPTLDRIAALVDLLGEPHRGYPIVHLTGTNGKTSTARMVDALLSEIGLRTGRYTSPHLQRATERINVDNRPVTVERYVEVFRQVAPFVDLVDASQPVKLSKFEILTAMGFAAFADAPVEAGVVEVGVGGRWDATNVADGAVAVVLPVGLDHAQYLGDTPAKIALEKAGIIKEGATAVLARQRPEVAEVLAHRCAEVGATVAQEGVDFGVVARSAAVGGQVVTLQGLRARYDDLFLPLYGAHQAQNAAVALAAVEAFTGDQPLDADLVASALAQVTSPGRLEVVRRSPTIVLDAAHNPHGAAAVAEALDDSFAFDPLIGVMGVMADKDHAGLLEAFESHLAHVVCTQNSTERALPAERLAEAAREIYGEDRVTVAPRLTDALDLAAGLAEAGESGGSIGSGAVLVTGSVVTVGEARSLLKGRR